MLVEILRSHCDLRFVRSWRRIIRLEDHCRVNVELIRHRSFFTYNDPWGSLCKALLRLASARVFEDYLPIWATQFQVDESGVCLGNCHAAAMHANIVPVFVKL